MRDEKKFMPLLLALTYLACVGAGTILRSPKDAANQPAPRLVSKPTYRLAWRPSPSSNLSYEVWCVHPNYSTQVCDYGSNRVRVLTNRSGAVVTNTVRYRTNIQGFLTNWQIYTTTTQTQCVMSTTGTCGFFKVRARDTNTGMVSEWSAK